MQNAINVLFCFVGPEERGSPGALAQQGDQKKSGETEKRAKKKSLDSFFFSLSHFVTVWTVDDV